MRAPNQVKNSMQTIMNLLGVEEFKDVVNALEVFRKNKEHSTERKVKIPNFLWVFQRGGGITKCVETFSEYLFDTKIFEFRGKYKYFEYIPTYVAEELPFTEITDLNNIITDNAGHHFNYQGIACIILDNWIGRTHEDHFQELLDFLRNKNDKVLCIFCVTTDDHTEIEDIESSIASDFWFETIHFRFPDTQELIEYFETRFLKKHSFVLSDDAKILLSDTIDDIASGENFNGFVTIRELSNDILFKVLSSPIYTSQSQTMQNGTDFEITAKMLSDFHKNSAYIRNLKKKVKSERSIGFNTDIGR